MKYSQTAHNQPVPPSADAQVSIGPGAGASSAPGTASSENFVQVLAQSDPQQQEQIIGEQLYRQIYALHPELTGKITGQYDAKLS